MEHTLHRPARPEMTAQREQSLRQLTLAMYLLYGFSLFTGLPVVVALMLNYVRLSESRGTIYHSHLRWALHTFWWGMAWTLLGWCMLALGAGSILNLIYGGLEPSDLVRHFAGFSGTGMVVLALNWLWLLSRLVRGLLNWNEYRRMR